MNRRADPESESAHLIVGAGCAGLSLALQLPEDASVTLVDRRERFLNDRTWCYWETEEHPFVAAAQHRWYRWKVRHRGWEVEQRSGLYPYRHLPADRFYAHAFEQLDRRPQVRWALGRGVDTLADEGARVRATAGDRSFYAARAYDSRPAPSSRGVAPWLLQHFVGWHVRAPGPIFDPEVVTLMDFDVPQERGLHFLYVLPFSAEEALVESTFFSKRTHPLSVYRDALRDYLQRRFDATQFEIVREERGALPMDSAPCTPRPAPRIWRLGLAGGLARPSTGYAFLAIQRWSEAFADRLRASDLPAPPPVRSKLSAWMDRIFLACIAETPELAPERFFELFARTPADPLIRFLSDRANPADLWSVVRSLQATPFAEQALRLAEEGQLWSA